MNSYRRLAVWAASAACLLVCATGARAIGSLTVNNLTSGTINTPGDLVLRAACPSGGRVLFVFILDADADGVSDAGEVVVETLLVTDGKETDENTAAGQVKFTFRLAAAYISAPMVVRAVDYTATAMEHGYTLTYASQGQTISGKVYDHSGAGQAGVWVRAEIGTSEFTAHTETDGSYSISIPLGVAEVYMAGPNYLGVVPSPRRYILPLDSAGSSQTGVNFRLARQGIHTLSGHIEEPAPGHPIPGARVSLKNADIYAATVTDVNGDYLIYAPAGGYTWLVEPPSGWFYVAGYPSLPGTTVKNVPNMAQATLYVTGKVLDGATGVVGAKIHLVNEAGDDTTGSFLTRSNASGQYIVWLPIGCWTPHITCPGYSQVLVPNCVVTDPLQQEGDVPIVHNSYTISGRVSLTPSGAGVRAWVSAHDFLNQYGGEWWAATNPNGDYSVAVPASTWVLSPQMTTGFYSTAQNITVPPSGTLNFTTAGLGPPITLTGGSVTPGAGVPTTEFVYQVTYTSGNNYLPDQVCVLIDGLPYAMTQANPDDHNAADGMVFTCPYIGPALATGSHAYRFIADTPFSTITSNAGGPTIANYALDQPSLAPASGSTATTFTASARYTHVLNTAPTAAQFKYRLAGGSWTVVSMTTGDTTYSDGSIFTWSGAFPAGQIEYYFAFVADGNTLRLPDAGAYAGPLVTGPPTTPVVTDDGQYVRAASGSLHATWTCTSATGIAEYQHAVGTAAGGTDVRGWTSAGTNTAATISGLTLAAGTSYFVSVKARGGNGLWSAVGSSNGITAQAYTFDDVPPSMSVRPYVEALVREGLAGGCSASPPLYCPDAGVNRAQMAKFLCAAAGKAVLDRATPTFADVPKSHWAYGFVERLADAASWGGSPPTGGCRVEGTTKYFCPNDAVTREQMAKFLCVATSRTQMPTCAGTFADVTAANAFCRFIERLADSASWPGGVAVTGGCSAGPPRLYCPKTVVTRGQMAVFLVKAFGITL